MNETIHRPDSRLLTPLGWWRLQWLNSLNIEGLHVQVDLFSELIGGTGLPAMTGPAGRVGFRVDLRCCGVFPPAE